MFFKKFENDIPNGYLITEENLRHVLTQVDFDANPQPELFESLGYAVIIISDKPVPTPYQIVTEYETRNSDGTWLQNWQVSEVSAEERKQIFDKQLKLITDQQNHLLEIYASQLADPNETPEELVVIQNWIDATNGMDISDPFNVVWPDETWPGLTGES